MAKATQEKTAKKAAKPKKAAAKTVTITLRKSPIGFNRNQATVVQSIGLRKINHAVTLADTPETRGMIFKVRHLVTVSE